MLNDAHDSSERAPVRGGAGGVPAGRRVLQRGDELPELILSEATGLPPEVWKQPQSFCEAARHSARQSCLRGFFNLGSTTLIHGPRFFWFWCFFSLTNRLPLL